MKLLHLSSKLYFLSEMTVFFRDPESLSWRFGIGIFKFELDRKIPKIPKKIPGAKTRKSRDRDREMKIPKKHKKNPEKSFLENPKKIPGSGIGI